MTHNLAPALFVLVALVASACGSGGAVETSVGDDASAEAGAGAGNSTADEDPTTGEDDGELTIRLTGEARAGGPAFEDFVVRVSTVTVTEQVTAVGDLGNGDNVLGSSCEQMLAEEPGILECEEFTDEVRQSSEGVDVGTFDAEGILTIPALDTESSLSVSALNPSDELCSFDGFADLDPGQTEVVFEYDLVLQDESCA